VSGISDLALSILMAAGLLLTGGGGWLIAKRHDYRRGGLMIVAGLVMFANVFIWTMPTR
jgi:LPXTG-motif cell wall-anchored protein